MGKLSHMGGEQADVTDNCIHSHTLGWTGSWNQSIKVTSEK